MLFGEYEQHKQAQENQPRFQCVLCQVEVILATERPDWSDDTKNQSQQRKCTACYRVTNKKG